MEKLGINEPKIIEQIDRVTKLLHQCDLRLNAEVSGQLRDAIEDALVLLEKFINDVRLAGNRKDHMPVVDDLTVFPLMKMMVEDQPSDLKANIYRKTWLFNVSIELNKFESKLERIIRLENIGERVRVEQTMNNTGPNGVIMHGNNHQYRDNNNNNHTGDVLSGWAEKIGGNKVTLTVLAGTFTLVLLTALMQKSEGRSFIGSLFNMFSRK